MPNPLPADQRDALMLRLWTFAGAESGRLEALAQQVLASAESLEKVRSALQPTQRALILLQKVEEEDTVGDLMDALSVAEAMDKAELHGIGFTAPKNLVTSFAKSIPGAAANQTEIDAAAVIITAALKAELIKALTRVVTTPADLKRRAEEALEDLEITDSVPWDVFQHAASELVKQTEAAGKIALLVMQLYKKFPANPYMSAFVEDYYPMFYKDPVVELTGHTSPSIFDSILIGRKQPLIDRKELRTRLRDMFSNPSNAPTVLSISGPSRAGKSYSWYVLRFLAEAGVRGQKEVRPHTDGAHRYVLLKPEQGKSYRVVDVAADLFSQLGWKKYLPAQHKSEDGWAQEVIYEFRNQVSATQDVLWIVADRYWDFPDAKPVLDFFLGLMREATLHASHQTVRLILVDFPPELIDSFVEENAAQGAVEKLSLGWLTSTDVDHFCRGFASLVKGNGQLLQPEVLFEDVEKEVDLTLQGAQLHMSWCRALQKALEQHW